MKSTCIVDAIGNKAWYSAWNILHREDGPAIIYKNGFESWYLNGIFYTKHKMPLSLLLAYCKWEYKKHGK